MLTGRTQSLTIVSTLAGLSLQLVLAAAPVHAQTLASGGAVPATFAGITLSASQVAQLQSLTATTLQRQRVALGAVKPGQAPDSGTRAALQRLAESHALAVRQLLTPAQQNQLTANERALTSARPHARGKAAADSAGGL